MAKYVVLLKMTKKGIEEISDSPKRAGKFKSAAEEAGVRVESELWTAGAYDGVILMDAPDDTAAAAAVLSVARKGYVTTQLLRAFDAAGFQKVLDKLT